MFRNLSRCSQAKLNMDTSNKPDVTPKHTNLDPYLVMFLARQLRLKNLSGILEGGPRGE